MKKTRAIMSISPAAAVCLAIAGFTLIGCNKPTPDSADASAAQGDRGSGAVSKIGKKVLFVDSYHKGYPWSEGIISGMLAELRITLDANDTPNTLDSPVELKVIRMDTKRNTSPEFIRQAAGKAKAVIDYWQPDLVISPCSFDLIVLSTPIHNPANLP